MGLTLYLKLQFAKAGFTDVDVRPIPAPAHVIDGLMRLLYPEVSAAKLAETVENDDDETYDAMLEELAHEARQLKARLPGGMEAYRVTTSLGTVTVLKMEDLFLDLEGTGHSANDVDPRTVVSPTLQVVECISTEELVARLERLRELWEARRQPCG